MFMRMRVLLAAVGVTSLAVSALSAQTPDAASPSWSAPPANLTYVEGTVDVVHGGVRAPADPPLLLDEGSRVQTLDGRAEIVLADGTLVHVDRASDLELLADGRWRLLAGRVLVRASAASAALRIDAPAATTTLEPRGEYDLTSDTRRGTLELAAIRGVAILDEGGRDVVVRAGEVVTLDGGRGPRLERFNTARLDAFAEWADGRDGGFGVARSAARLPGELRPYGPVFDQYGRWDYVAPHGYVWFPAVSVGWRPYYDGFWGHTRYGWTWSGRDRWAWPTHHYGRWGFSGVSWYWIPARVWGPAWVSWGIGPSYVSWSPLGWDNRPVFSVLRRDHPAYAPHYSPWRSWTVIPRTHFGQRGPIRAWAIDGDRLDEQTRRSLVFQNAAPPRPGNYAVPRGSLSVAGPTTRDNRPGDVRRPPSGARGENTSAPSAAAPQARVGATAGVPPRTPRRNDAPNRAMPAETGTPGPARSTTGWPSERPGAPADGRAIDIGPRTGRSAEDRATAGRRGDSWTAPDRTSTDRAVEADPGTRSPRGMRSGTAERPGPAAAPRETPRAEPRRSEPRAAAPAPRASEPARSPSGERGAVTRSPSRQAPPSGTSTTQPRSRAGAPATSGAPRSEGGARRRPN